MVSISGASCSASSTARKLSPGTGKMRSQPWILSCSTRIWPPVRVVMATASSELHGLFQIVLELRQHRHRPFGVGADPALVNGVDGEGVEVVPALAPAPLGDDQVGRF